MTPKNKKSLLVISGFVIVGGAIAVGLYMAKEAKEGKKGSLPENPPAPDNNVPTNTQAPPDPNVGIGETKYKETVKASRYGFKFKDDLYSTSPQTGAYKNPSVARENRLGYVKSRGSKPSAKFIRDSKVAGWIYVKTFVTDMAGKTSLLMKDVFVPAKLYTNKKQ